MAVAKEEVTVPIVVVHPKPNLDAGLDSCRTPHTHSERMMAAIFVADVISATLPLAI
jgi:hypothetical protein